MNGITYPMPEKNFWFTGSLESLQFHSLSCFCKIYHIYRLKYLKRGTVIQIITVSTEDLFLFYVSVCFVFKELKEYTSVYEKR